MAPAWRGEYCIGVFSSTRCLTVLLLLAAGWPAPATASPDAGPPPTEKELLRAASRLAREVRVQRQLRPRHKLKMEVLKRDALAARRKAALEASLDPERLAVQSRVLAALGVLEGGVDLRAELLRRLTVGEPGPFYHARKDLILLRAGVPLKRQRLALSLAVCHALVDQRFRLRRLRKEAEKSTDARLAVRALAEGDCATLMMEIALGPHALEPSTLGAEQEALLSRALAGDRGKPRDFLARQLVFPYLTGAAFVRQLRSRYPWALLRKAYSRPPESTEQVMHYERYWDRDRPDRFRTRKLKALDSMKELTRDTLGEFMLGSYLAGGVDADTARRAAAGWGGDLLVAHEQGEGGALLLIHLTSWDSDIDAREFASAQAHLFTERGHKAEATGEDAGSWRFTDSGGKVWSQRLKGRYVLTLMGVPADRWQALEAEVRKQWRINGRRMK